jgi:hypothetical protein
MTISTDEMSVPTASAMMRLFFMFVSRHSFARVH